GSPLLRRAIEDGLREQRKRTGHINPASAANQQGVDVNASASLAQLPRSRGAAVPRNADTGIKALLSEWRRDKDAFSVSGYMLAQSTPLDETTLRGLQRKFERAKRAYPD